MEWLPWTDASGLAASAAVATPLLAAPRRLGRVLRGRARQVAPSVSAWTRELAVMFGLYALWQLAGDLSVGGRTGAVGRGRAIYRLERRVGLPSEASFQRLFLGEHWLLRIFNLYYVGLHVALMGACLVWVFARHRDRYPVVRNTLALSTGVCLLVALVPVAPPRLVPGLGLVDTGRLVGPTVYPATDQPGVDQLSAMPSVHVAWALVVAFALFIVLRSRWRALAFLYPVFTTTVVVATGNHYWSDGLVASAIVAASAWISLRLAASSGARVSWRRRDAPDPAPLSPPAPECRPSSDPSSPARV